MKPIENADFGKTADDYLAHRAGFPASLFERLAAWGVGTGGQVMVDLGTGTGTLARGFAQRGNRVTGIDPAQAMLDAAKSMDGRAGVEVDYRVATAEATGLADASADVVSAGQCWHWFDPAGACAEIRRILKPGGLLVVCHYDWLPLSGNVVRLTEKLIEKYNPAWKGGNLTGIHPRIFRDLGEGGFGALESFTYDEPAVYTHEGWRGRIRASAGVSATLDAAQVANFDRELQELLSRAFSAEPLVTPHRVFALKGTAPAG